MTRHAGLAAALLTLLAAAAGPGAIAQAASARLDDPAAVRDYWTPQRLATAYGVHLPAVDLAPPPEIRRTFEAAAAQPDYDRRPAEPRSRRAPDFERFLFDPALFRGPHRTRQLLRTDSTREVPFAPTAKGNAGLYYSSSRLVPEDARVVFPYSAVGKLFFSTGGSDFVCSGAVISARIVATAGHCVFSSRRFHRNFLFVPAYHEGNAPYGEWGVDEVFTTDAWTDGDDLVPNEGDYGMLVVADEGGERIGDVTGWLGFKTNQLAPNAITILGYPVNLDGGQQMHHTTSSDWDSVDATGSIVYGSDMGGGASGGPWVMNFGQKARGQNRGRNRLDNRIVGHSSFGSSDANFLVLGSSPLDGSYRDLFNEACAGDPRNCQKRGKTQRPRN
jgi:V8-like Glu-specific endopeptidase